jgi:hypothetical protein
MDMNQRFFAAVGAVLLGVGAMVVALPPSSAPPTLSEARQKRIASKVPDLGANASLNGKPVFPSDSPWNQRVDRLPADPLSSVYVNSIGAESPLHPDFGTGNNGIPYLVVSGTTPKASIDFEYGDESDPGPYPIPQNAPIEGGSTSDGDRHILVVDRDHWKLYELFSATPTGKGFKAGSGAAYDLNSNRLRPDGWTSADAAGLPIFPGLVRYDEVMEQKAIPHALRFTVKRTQTAYVAPARHFASKSSDPTLPPMGLRVRLKADYDISGFPPSAQVILKALKTYGMILADNGGNWFVSGAPDDRWNADDLNTLKRVKGRDFEVVKMGPTSLHP